MGALVKRTPGLLARPQPLGFLPTPRFWLDPDVRRLALPLRLIYASTLATMLGGLAWAGILSGPWWMFMGIATICVVLGIGQFERWIRRQAVARLADHDDAPREL